jgi:hypothetical protein
MGMLLAEVARRIDARVGTPSCSIRVPDRSDKIARWFGSGSVFLDWCADVCSVAYALDADEREVLRGRLQAGSVRGAAKILHKSVGTIANVSTRVFAKLGGIAGAHELPRAIEAAAGIVRSRREPATVPQLALAFASQVAL